MGGKVDVAFHYVAGNLSSFSTIGLIGSSGLHRARISKSGQQLEFSIDVDYNGTFVADLIRTIPNIGSFAPVLNATNSHIFFGTSTIIDSFDDFKISFTPTTPVTVDVNIRPNKTNIRMNTCSHGNISTMIWGAKNLDVSTIDLEKLTLAGGYIRQLGIGSKLLCKIKDFGSKDELFFDSFDPTADGILDLKCSFVLFNMPDLTLSSTTATFNITGCDNGINCVASDAGFYNTTAVEPANPVYNCE